MKPAGWTPKIELPYFRQKHAYENYFAVSLIKGTLRRTASLQVLENLTIVHQATTFSLALK